MTVKLSDNMFAKNFPYLVETTKDVSESVLESIDSGIELNEFWRINANADDYMWMYYYNTLSGEYIYMFKSKDDALIASMYAS